MTKLYCAGTIDKGDWRTDLMGRDEISIFNRGSFSFPILRLNDQYDYVGPYFIGCDHGCYHGPKTHGIIGAGSACCELMPTRPQVYAECLAAIDRCDVFFAWFDSLAAYGTLVELGYAKARGKKTIVAFQSDRDLDELWFADECSDRYLIKAKSVFEALHRAGIIR